MIAPFLLEKKHILFIFLKMNTIPYVNTSLLNIYWHMVENKTPSKKFCIDHHVHIHNNVLKNEKILSFISMMSFNNLKDS